MRIDLAAQARTAGTRRDVVLRPIIATKAQSDDLARLYMGVVRVWATGSRERLMPEYRRSLAEIQTDSPIDLEWLIEAISQSAVRYIATFRGEFQAWADDMVRWHTRRFIANLRYATNVDLTTQIYASDVAETVEDVLARNVALIRDVSDQTRGRIADIVLRGLGNRTHARQVAREISEATGLARKRALRIASDQAQKLAASLDRDRQTQMGMEEFEWRHSGKVHYRPEHKARDGKVFRWDGDVGRNDPPGYQPYCGCKARGILRID